MGINNPQEDDDDTTTIIKGYYIKIYDPYGFVLRRIQVTLVKDTYLHLTIGNGKFVGKILSSIHHDLEDKT